MRFLVKGLWLAVKCVPPAWRRGLRKNMLLSSWYTAMLCKAGLHPSVNMAIAETRQHTTSELPLDQDYLANVAIQQGQIDALLKPHTMLAPNCSVCILVEEYEQDTLQRSLRAIYAQSVPPHTIILLGDKQATEVLKEVDSEQQALCEICIVEHLDELVEHATYSQACFVINQGDELHADCLAVMMVHSANNADAQLSYVDTDQCLAGNRYDPYLLPDWNPDYQLSAGYIRTGVFASALALLNTDEMNAFSIQDFMRQQYWQDPQIEVAHIPLVLVHRNNALDMQETDIINSAELFPIKTEVLVSLVIPTFNGKDLVQACIDSILEKTQYEHYEILLIDNNSNDPDALAYFTELDKHEKIRVLPYPHPFNYSAINNFAVGHAKGEVIGLINNDIEVIEGDWLGNMLAHCLRDDIACVGAKLLYSNGLVQHAGVVMGYGGGAGHAHKYFTAEHSGYMCRAIATQNFSAVTAACLLVSKADYEAVGGLNEHDLTVAFNDVDFCLRLLQSGKRNLLCAEAVLYHHESVSRGHEDTLEKQQRFRKEVDYLQSTWAQFIVHDPAYNPNLTRKYENFTINTELSH